MSNRIRLRRRTLVRRGLPLALGGLLVTGTSVAWATAGDDSPHYRTAEAATGSVEQVLVRTGTIEKVLQAAASFPVSGTVSSVAVAVGDKVDAGDVLAKLDRTDLKAAVNAAKATLAKAKATLESDENGTSSGGSSTSSGSGSSGSSGSSSAGSSGSGSSGSGLSGGAGAGGSGGAGAGGSGGAGAGGATGGALDFTREVAAVNAAQQTATAAATTADAALAAQRTVCDPFTGTDAEAAAAALVHTPVAADSDDDSDSDSDVGEEGTDPETGTPPTTTVDTAPLIACITAVDATAEAQTALGRAQTALAQQDAALATAMDLAVATLTTAAAAAQAAAQSTAAAAAQAAAQSTAAAATAAAEAAKAAAERAAASTASTGASRSSAGSTVSDAARIAVDEAAIRAAEAEVAAAEEEYDGAVLHAPIDGVVGALPFTKGATASSSDAATILGDGGVRVTVNVPLSAVTALKIGTPATVSADGASDGSAGEVESVGLLPTSTSGTATYPVAVYVAKPAAALTEGSAATVALALKSATDAVTVPNSALTMTSTGSTGYVLLLENGKSVRRTVTYGAVGSATTEIVSGLEEGATVILADPSQDVPASSTSSTRSFGGGNTFVPGGAQFGGNIARRN